MTSKGWEAFQICAFLCNALTVLAKNSDCAVRLSQMPFVATKIEHALLCACVSFFTYHAMIVGGVTCNQRTSDRAPHTTSVCTQRLSEPQLCVLRPPHWLAVTIRCRLCSVQEFTSRTRGNAYMNFVAVKRVTHNAGAHYHKNRTCDVVWRSKT